MKRTTALKLFIPVVMALAGACTLPPPLSGDTALLSVRNQVLPPSFTTFDGAGRVTIGIGREQHSGDMDVSCETGEKFKSNVYSPFGGIIAEISADSECGAITFGKQVYRFNLDETMDSLPFAWGKSLTFRQFISMMTGRVCNDKMVQIPPDTIITRKAVVDAVWRLDTMQVNALVRRKDKIVDALVYSVTKAAAPYTAEFAGFRQGLATQISLKDTAGNFFSVAYDKISVH